jgi:phage tail-like protein
MAYGQDRKLHDKFKFVVQSRRFGYAAFQKMSEISAESASIDYYEGGAIIPIKEPGRLTFADVTLERGTSRDYDMHNWFVVMADASADVGGAGAVSPEFKSDDLAVLQRDRDNTRLRQWVLIGSFPNKYVAGDWDNTVDEVVIETLTIRYDYFLPR